MLAQEGLCWQALVSLLGSMHGGGQEGQDPHPGLQGPDIDQAQPSPCRRTLIDLIDLNLSGFAMTSSTAGEHTVLITLN